MAFLPVACSLPLKKVLEFVLGVFLFTVLTCSVSCKIGLELIIMPVNLVVITIFNWF